MSRLLKWRKKKKGWGCCESRLFDEMYKSITKRGGTPFLHDFGLPGPFGKFKIAATRKFNNTQSLSSERLLLKQLFNGDQNLLSGLTIERSSHCDITTMSGLSVCRI
jgi:hypothetical protein